MQRSHAHCLSLVGWLVCGLCLLTASPNSHAQQQTDAATQTAFVAAPADSKTLTVTVTDDEGRLINGLGKESFTLLVDNKPQEIISFASTETPISIGFLFDVSGSMEGIFSPVGKDKRYPIYNGVARFLQASNPANDYFLSVFDKKVYDPFVDTTTDGRAILKAIEQLSNLKTKGQTALNDACYAAMLKATAGKQPKHVIILVSDGQDNQSQHSWDELRRLLKEQDVLIYAIGLYKEPANELDIAGQAKLDEIALLTGGKAYFTQSEKGLYQIFELIAAELRQQYSLTFSPAKAGKGNKWHSLKLKATPPPGVKKHLLVRSHTGFFSALAQP